MKTYMCLGVLQFNFVICKEMKDMISKERYRRIRKILKARVNAGNTRLLMQYQLLGRAVSIIRYRAGIVQRRKNEPEAINRETRKLLTMYRSVHPRADVDRLYCEMKNGRKALISVEQCIRIEKNSFGFLLERTRTTTTKAVIEGVILDDENPKDVKAHLLQQRKENYDRKRMYSVFMRGTEEVTDGNNSWLRMKKRHLKKGTGVLVMAAQDQSLQTRWIKHYIDRTTDSPKC